MTRRAIGRLLCRLNHHDWHHWEGGFVYGPSESWACGFTECRRCRRRKP